MRTRFTERYGCRYPFAGAGMAFACETPGLAVAVCEAGGIGALSGHVVDDMTEGAARVLAGLGTPAAAGADRS